MKQPPKKILLIFGTRPEAIKMAPVYQSLRKYDPILDARVLVTAQHREMLDQVLNLFAIKPHYDLNAMTHCQGLTQLAATILPGIDNILKAERPAMVLVHGDTSTTFLAALASYYNQVTICHVEAGLRTHNKYSPFPEEMNRHLTGVLADWHFAPTSAARDNLVKENIDPDRIFVTGNTVIDALLATVRRTQGAESELLRAIPGGQRIILVTTHRRENLGEPLRQVYAAIRRIVEEHPEVEVVFPVHLNPAVRGPVQEILGAVERVHICDPLDYAPFVQAMNRSYIVLTDSGGIQEEAPALGKPVLVLRDTTERPEAVEAGTVSLVGTDFASVYGGTKKLLTDPALYERMSQAVNPYGDGMAADRITDFLLWKMGINKKKPSEFTGMGTTKSSLSDGGISKETAIRQI